MGAIRVAIHALEKLENALRACEQREGGSAETPTIEQIDAATLDFLAPSFVLSTGRCGTLWLTELLRASRRVYANHSDRPELIRHSRLAYEQYDERPDVFQEVLRAARDEFIILAHKQGKTYVETNNRITFFARAARQVYPNARFVHLVRHPGDFTCSGLGRGWYRGHPHDVARITRRTPARAWQAMTDVEKIAWLWNETNLYIEDFLGEVAPERQFRVKAEDMFADAEVALDLCRFIGVDNVSKRHVARMQRRRVNVGKGCSLGPYRSWPDSSREEVRTQATLGAAYGYEL